MSLVIRVYSKMERCSKCNRKVACIFHCTCKKLFCVRCQLPEVHECTFDHKAQYKEFLESRNPKITPQKIDKI